MIWQDEKMRLAVRLLEKRYCEKDAVDAVFSGLDLDTADYGLLMILSLAGHRCGWLHFPKAAVSRLSGLNRFNRVRNHTTLEAAIEACSMLERGGITHVLTGSIAAACYCDRIMLDKIRCARIAVGCMPAFDVPDRVVCIREDAIGMIAGESRSARIDGCDLTVPCPEDVLADILADECFRIMAGRAGYDSLQWVADLCELSSVVDWSRLRQRSVAAGVFNPVSVMLNLAEALVPGVVPPASLDRGDVRTGWFERRFRLGGKSIWCRLLHYVPDRKTEWNAMRRLCLTEEAFLPFLFRAALSHFRRMTCCVF